MRAEKLSVLIILLFAAAFAPAATRHVPAQYPNIQAAINDANDGDTVIIAPGTYTGHGNRDIEFKGKPITVRSMDPNDPDVVAETVVDCQGAGRGFSFENGEKATSVLSGLTIAKGYADLGGGILCDSSSPTITHCAIAQCTAVGGGGIFAVRSGPVVVHCTLTDNKAADAGGGFWLSYGTARITRCVLNANYAHQGGGFYLDRGADVIQKCLVVGNSAALVGGGIRTSYSSPSIINCVIAQNSAGGTDPSTGSCGGLYFHKGTPVITNSSIIDNSANVTGGGIICWASTLTVTNSVIWANTAPRAANVVGGCNIRYTDVEGGFPGPGNIDADPLFADLAGGDYHLQAGSPCIDAGNPAQIPAPGQTDIDGDPRLFGGRVDMGVDEFLMPGRSAIVVYPATVGFTIFEGHEKPQHSSVEIWNVGVGSLNWQISEDCAWLQADPQSGTSRGEHNEITLTADVSALAWGHFDCNLAISDPNAFNSPLLVPVSLDVVGPILSVGSSQLDFQAGKENPTPPEQILSIQNTSGGTLNWQIATPNDCNWLSVYPPSGRSTGQVNDVTISVDATGLEYGSYSCQLLISDPNAQHGLEAIQVNLTLKAPVLAVEPGEFQFHAGKDNPKPPEQILSIHNAGGDTLYWQISMPDNCPWLTVYPLSGRSADDVNEITLTIDTTALANGFYNCALTVSDPNAANSPQTVHVRMHVGLQKGLLYVPTEFANIQSAIDWALPADVVLVAPGRYTGPGNRDIDFLGKPITVRSIDPNDPEIVASTIIDCNGAPYTYYGAFHFHSGEDSNSILSGLTITNAYAYGFAAGAILCDNSSPTISNCTISGSRCTGGRVCSTGGIHCYKSSSMISNCTISGNLSGWGGGIYCRKSSLVVTGCQITANTSATGGGIYCWQSNLLAKSCLFTGNSTEQGGAIYAEESNLIVDNCIFSRNSAESYGGAIFNSRGDLSLANATLTGNHADSRGGALYLDYSGKATISDSILYYNIAPSGPEIALAPYYRPPQPLDLAISYSNIHGGPSGVWTQQGVPINWGPGNIDAEPHFVDPNNSDYHLKSQGWRWDTDRKLWTWDDVTSRCIDAGDPRLPLGDEPLAVPADPNNEWGENLRINMGAFGGTAEAAIGPPGWTIPSDYTNDGIANFADFAFFSQDRPFTAGKYHAEPDPTPTLSPLDLALFADRWLDRTTWFGSVPPPEAAWNPNPPDRALGVGPHLTYLTWLAGIGAESHNIYLGTDPVAVADATTASPQYKGNRIETQYHPGALLYNTTYYWRIDEVGSQKSVVPGPVWTFTTRTGGTGGR